VSATSEKSDRTLPITSSAAQHARCAPEPLRVPDVEELHSFVRNFHARCASDRIGPDVVANLPDSAYLERNSTDITAQTQQTIKIP